MRKRQKKKNATLRLRNRTTRAFRRAGLLSTVRRRSFIAELFAAGMLVEKN